jgi:cytochrome P450
MTIPPPEPAHFDPAQGAWILSRYADVLAALREPSIWPEAATGEDMLETRNDTGRLRIRAEALEAFSGALLVECRKKMEPLARCAVQALPVGRPVDLVREFARPWCLTLAIEVVNAESSDSGRLAHLSAQVFGGIGAPEDPDVRSRAAEATSELEALFQGGSLPMREPAFVALAQTVPRLMGSIWLALLQHPTEVARLRAQPDLLPGAVEELLRFAGIVRRIWRRATADIELAGVSIRQGDRIMLMLASANRDPAQFPNPERLDVTRRATNQLALGTGRNSCVGAQLIKMALTVATGALLERFTGVDLAGTPDWQTGSGYAFPSSLPVRFQTSPL